MFLRSMPVCFLVPSHNARSLPLFTVMMLDVSLSWGQSHCHTEFTRFQSLITLLQYGSLGPLNMVHLGLVIGGRIDFLVLHQP